MLTNLLTILISSSQALFVWLYPFLMVLMAYLYRHISILFAFSSGSLDQHWLPILPFVWCGKYSRRNHYEQILSIVRTKLLVVQPKVFALGTSSLELYLVKLSCICIGKRNVVCGLSQLHSEDLRLECHRALANLFCVIFLPCT